MTYNSPSPPPSPSPSPRINKIGHVGAFKDRATYVIEATDLKSEVRHDLQGCLESVVTSEAAKRAHTIEAICTWMNTGLVRFCRLFFG